MPQKIELPYVADSNGREITLGEADGIQKVDAQKTALSPGSVLSNDRVKPKLTFKTMSIVPSPKAFSQISVTAENTGKKKKSEAIRSITPIG